MRIFLGLRETNENSRENSSGPYYSSAQVAIHYGCGLFMGIVLTIGWHTIIRPLPLKVLNSDDFLRVLGPATLAILLVVLWLRGLRQNEEGSSMRQESSAQNSPNIIGDHNQV